VTSEQPETVKSKESQGNEHRQARKDTVRRKKPRLLDSLSHLGVRILRWFDDNSARTETFIFIILVCFIALDIAAFKMLGKKLSVVEITGSLACLFFLKTSRNVKDRLIETIDSLTRRGVVEFWKQDRVVRLADQAALHYDHDQFPGLQGVLVETINKRAGLWALASALLFIVLGFGFVVVRWPEFSSHIQEPYFYNLLDSRPLMWILLVFCLTFTVGFRLGRMTSYGYNTIGYRRLSVQEWRPEFQPQPGHLDGKCGLRPLNNFLFFQAMTVMVLFAYLAAWLLILERCDARINPNGNSVQAEQLTSNGQETRPVSPLNESESSLPEYCEIVPDPKGVAPIFLGAMTAILGLQYFGLVWPVFSVRRRVMEEKRYLESEADTIWKEIGSWTVKLEKEEYGTPEWTRSQYYIEKSRQRYSDIERMRFWPLAADSAGATILMTGQSVVFLFSALEWAGFLV